MAWLTMVATGCMVSAVFATLIQLLAIPGSRLEQTSLLPPPTTRAIEGLIASLNLCFAYGGQVSEGACSPSLRADPRSWARCCTGSPSTAA